MTEEQGGQVPESVKEPGRNPANFMASAVLIVVVGLTALTGAGLPVLKLYAENDERFDGVELQLDRLQHDRWRGRDQQAWAAQFQAMNPTAVRVPPVVLPEGGR